MRTRPPRSSRRFALRLGLCCSLTMLAAVGGWAQQQPTRAPTPRPAAPQAPTPTPRPTPRATPPAQRPPRPAQPPQRVESAVPPPRSPIARRDGDSRTPPPEQLPAAPRELPKINLIYKQEPIESIFRKINEDTGVVVRAMEAVQGETVDLVARDKNIEEILDELLIGRDWTWIQREDGSYEMWDEESFTDIELRKRVIRRIIPIRYVDAGDIQPAIDGLKSEVGQIAVNPRTNELIVTDLPDKVALIESVVKELDVQLFTQQFFVRYANFEDVHPQIGEIKSPAGLVMLDPINRRIIATDTFQKLKQMQQLLDMIDVDRPMVLYHLNSIGLDGADAEDFISNFIEPIATPDALLQYSETQSVLVVKDIPEIHDRIVELMKALDRSPKQVWIEGEILEVRHDFSFSYGVEATYDADLINAFKTENISLPRITTGGGGLTVLDLVGDWQYTLSAIMNDDSFRLLLQPRVLVRNLEEAIIDLTQENPQVTTFFNNSQGGFSNFSSSSITFVPTGLSLSLTPIISNRGLIEMDIDFENSSPIFVELMTGNGQSQSAVGRNTQHIQTVLVIPSGETRVLGGLISRAETESSSGLPFLARIPILGGFFGSKSTDRNKRNLLFFLTPTIVQEEPQFDLISMPINAMAKQLQSRSSAYLEAPATLNPIPDDLIQYLIEERPEMSPPVQLGPPQPPGARLERIEGMLINDPFRFQSEPLDIRGRGAELLRPRGGFGPSGTVRTQARPIAPPRRPASAAASGAPSQAGQPPAAGQPVPPGAVPPPAAGRTPGPTPPPGVVPTSTPIPGENPRPNQPRDNDTKVR